MLRKMQTIFFSGLIKARQRLSGKGISKIVPGTQAIYELLFRMFWPNTNVVEVQGSKMYVDVFDPDPSMRRTFRAYAINRVHEESTTSLFRSIVKEGDVVVDLGANVGYFTLLSAKLVGSKGKVYAFEPEPQNYRYLLKNIQLNGYDNVVASQKAVADRSGKVNLFFCRYDTGHHTIQQYDGIQAYRPDFVDIKKEFVEVDQVCLDDFFKGIEAPVNVIKMEVVGAEMLALAGMEKLFKRNKKLVMLIEFFPLLISEMGQSPEEFARRLLEDFNFTVSVVEHDYSMDKVFSEGRLRISSVDQLMSLCTERNAHLNLYLEKSGTDGQSL
jgi:FkbM family methyltransferase